MNRAEHAEALDVSWGEPEAGPRGPSLVPFRQQVGRCRTADGVHIAHASCGHGPLLVKASNGLGHLEFDPGSGVWGPLLAELSSGHTLARHDRRGCGLSDWDVPEVSLQAWVADLEAVVASRGLERFPLLGVSDGALVALAYAARHPARVSRLVLHGAWARPGRRVEGAWCLEADSADLAEAATSAALADRMRRVEAATDLTPLLPQVVCPVLLLHGRDDEMVPLAEAEWLAQALPDAHLTPLDTASHWPRPNEPAWDDWLHAVRRFLPPAPDPGSPLARLTDREADVLDLLAQGRDNTAVARLLGLSTKTVRNHVSNLYRKLGTSTRARTAAMAREAGHGRTFRPGPLA